MRETRLFLFIILLILGVAGSLYQFGCTWETCNDGILIVSQVLSPLGLLFLAANYMSSMPLPIHGVFSVMIAVFFFQGLYSYLISGLLVKVYKKHLNDEKRRKKR